MMSVTALAAGYLVMNVFGTTSNVSGDICSTLFGFISILTLSNTEVILCSAMAAVVVACFVLLYNRIFAVTFDETFVEACGMDANRYNLVIAIMIALVIVVGMNLVGALLLSALVVFPALSAMRVCGSFRGVTVCSAVLGTTCALAGMLLSILVGTPIGSTIVMLDAACFALCCLIGR